MKNLDEIKSDYKASQKEEEIVRKCSTCIHYPEFTSEDCLIKICTLTNASIYDERCDALKCEDYKIKK